MQNLKDSVLRILKPNGDTAGTGFLISPTCVVTCAHVISQAGHAPGDTVTVEFVLDQTPISALVLSDGWSARGGSGDDIAFLQLAYTHPAARPVVLGTAEGRQTHRFISFGCAPVADRLEHDAGGGLGHTVRRRGVAGPLLRLEGDDVIPGMSGAPVLDVQANRVVGMMTDYVDKSARARFAYATPADTLIRQHPPTRLWPDSHGPDDITAYLDYLQDTHGTLRLPDGATAPLERLYISLRADQMMATERQAEHDVYLETVEAEIRALEAQHGARLSPYERAALYRQVYTRRGMKMLEARDWEMQFGQRDRQSLNLAQVVQRHPHVVILGDPGMGKSTLCQWLALQFARARRAGVARVRVAADAVQPGQDAQTELDLGPARLPVLIRMADYARARWPKELGKDSRDVSLLDFVGHQLDTDRDRPAALTPECLSGLCREALEAGDVLLILDGLDEVSDLDQRRQVMAAIQAFITEYARIPVVLTSRVVGYQFQPLTYLPHYTVDALDEPAIRAFCRAWMVHQYSQPTPRVDDPDAAAQELAGAIFNHSHPGVRSLAGNPLLLTILADVYTRSNRTLPSRRVALFEEAARRLYEQREVQWDAVGVTFISLQRALGALATFVHGQSAAGYVEEEDVREALRTVLPRADQVEAVLQAARDLSGFLVERGAGVYAFLHRSLQEYFAAVDMAADPHTLLQRLAAHALDPTWREPVLLALGIVGSARHGTAAGRRAAFGAVLAAPDPAAAVLPRGALLLAAATPECERLPEDMLATAAATLLDALADVERRQGAAFLRGRLVAAFAPLAEHAQVRAAVEPLVVAAIGDDDYERRLAALSLVLEHNWYSPPIVRAISDSWQRYAGPAAAMLLALDRVQADRPELLAAAPLAFRDAVAADPALWPAIGEDTAWREVVRALYLRPAAPWDTVHIQRDSPWTQAILAAVRRREGPLVALGALWRAALTESESAGARDACLALAACGDPAWPARLIGRRRENGAQTRAVFATFLALSDRDLALARALARDRDRDRDRDRAGDLGLALDFALDLDLALALARALDLALARDLARDLARALDLDLARALARDLDRTRNRARDRDRALARDLARALLAQHAFDLARDLALDLDRALDLDLARDLAHTLDQASLTELLEYVQSARRRWSADPAVTDPLTLAESRVHELISSLESWQAPLYSALLSFSRVLIAAGAEDAPAPAPVSSDFSLNALPALLDALLDDTDDRRDAARAFLQSDRRASAVTSSTLLAMAQAAQEHDHQPAVGTQLDWSLKSIHHDDSALLASWLEQAAAAPKRAAERLLSTFNSVTPAFWKALLACLPHVAAHLNHTLLHAISRIVRLRGITDENGRRDSFEAYGGARRLLNWLAIEQDETTIGRLLSTLGHWPAPGDNETQQAVFSDLRQALSERWQARPAERPLLAEPLARLARHDAAWQPIVLEWLLTECDQPAVAAGYARLVCYQEQKRDSKATAEAVHSRLQAHLPAAACLPALLDAGTDDDEWDGAYHGILARAVRLLLLPEEAGDLRRALLLRCREAHETGRWPARRMALAALAACLEVMPTTLHKAAPFALEPLLVAAAADSGSHNVRRFALTALSYLHVITPAVAPALLAGCRDVAVVQNDAIQAAARFTNIEGNPVSELVAALTGGSLRTAYGAARVLGALGSALPEQRPAIVAGLVAAIQHPNAEREVFVLSEYDRRESKGKLAETLYEVLFQVAGWPT